MIIISWNVNGIKGMLTKLGVSIFEDLNADILCLQETKLSDASFEIPMSGYRQIYNNAKRSGYAGTCILSRFEPLSVAYGIGVLDEEGRAITAEFDDFFLVCVYAPSSGSGRMIEREAWDNALLRHVQALRSDKPVIACGDFNVSHQDNDVCSPSSFAGTPGFTSEERKSFSELINAGFEDTFRIFHKDESGFFTWWSYKGDCRSNNLGMRLDYVLASETMHSRIQSADILTDVKGSDHCPIVLSFHSNHDLRQDKESVGYADEPLVKAVRNTMTPANGKENPHPTAMTIMTSAMPSVASEPLSPIIGLRFARYDYTFEDGNGRRITRSFIVLRHADGRFWFTNIHKFIRSTNKKTHNLSQHGVSRFDYIIGLLNYAFFTCGIRKIEDLTIKIITKYLSLYAKGELDKQHKVPQQATIERNIQYIFDFIDLTLTSPDVHFRFKRDDLYREVTKRDKRGRVYVDKVPVFAIPYQSMPKPVLNRDMPQKAFFKLLDHIIRCHTDMLGLVMAGAFLGARPGEAVCIRCANSPLGPGIRFTVINGIVIKIEVDLTMERILRSDGKITGSIKKERVQKVPDLFLQPFQKCYEIYENYMATQKREPEYMAFSTDRNGRAITYATYLARFKKVVKEMIPIYLSSEDPDLVIYGRILMEHPITPHIFRHFFTVQLLLSGISDPGELMYLRGDTSPESALTYLMNKGELEREFSLVNNSTFDRLIKAAEQKRGSEEWI